MEPTRQSLDNYLASLPKRAGEHNAKLIQDFCRKLEAMPTEPGVKRLYAREVSFQATHKAIKKLYFEEILVKYGGYYKLNHDWLRQVGKFSNDVIERYGKHQTMLKDLP